jgi:hypothetical protein
MLIHGQLNIVLEGVMVGGPDGFKAVKKSGKGRNISVKHAENECFTVQWNLLVMFPYGNWRNF